MKLPRRNFLHLLAGAAALAAVPRSAWAQAYPTRPVRIIHVPYRGGGAVVSDLLGGQVQVLFGTTSLTAEQVRAGKLRALAVTGATRWEGCPTSRQWATSFPLGK